ncbi:MAG: HlyD family efflux transporter periplasmic adaptor subunit [Rhodospirillaceae bacterium]|nr:HlyD family efflux transporter periplasmic adaptor subunit [Rhodospirillaceae bacterium]
MAWKRALIPAAVALALGGIVWWVATPRPVPVETAAVVTGTLRETVEEEGKTRVRERYTISAPLAGTIARISLKQGDALDAGALVTSVKPNLPALHDARTLRELTERLGAAEAKVQAAIAGVAKAQAASAQAPIDLERAEALAARGNLAKAKLEQARLEALLRRREIDLAEAEKRAAEHDVEVAKAALQRYRRTAEGSPADSAEDVDAFDIRSPIAGRVLKVHQESAATVALGAPLIDVADTRQLEIVAEILTVDAVRIPAGAPVRITGWGGAKTLLGRVRLVEPAAFTKVSALGVEEQRVRVVIDFLSPPEEWASLGDAYRVDASVETYMREGAVLAPLGALFRDGANWSVFVVVDGRARHRRVEIGRRSGRETEILKGLVPGERVILYPTDRVGDGVAVSSPP